MQTNGISDYVSLSEYWMAGSLWTHRGTYINNSPVLYLDRVTTPLLVIHGSLDEQSPSFEADQLFVFLRRLGKEVRYVKYEGEGHGFTREANRIDCWNRIINWFDEHLKSTAEKSSSQ